jgi:hypothetical protein
MKDLVAHGEDLYSLETLKAEIIFLGGISKQLLLVEPDEVLLDRQC